MIVDLVLDIWNLITKIYRSPESEQKKSDLNKAMTEQVPHMLKLVEIILEANNKLKQTGFFVGDSVTLADIYLISFYDWLHEHKDSVLSKLQALKEHEERIKSLPKIAEHLKKHSNQPINRFYSSPIRK